MTRVCTRNLITCVSQRLRRALPVGLSGLALSLAGALGCSSTEDIRAPSDEGPPVVVIGTGVSEFLPIVDGDAVPIVRGIQGGYHIWGAVRAQHLIPDQVRLHYSLILLATNETVNTVDRVERLSAANALEGADSDGADWWQSTGSFVFVPMPAAIDQQPVRLQVDATDTADHYASDSRVIIPRAPTE